MKKETHIKRKNSLNSRSRFKEGLFMFFALMIMATGFTGCNELSNKKANEKSESISREVKIVMRMQDAALNLIEAEHERRMSFLTSKMVNNYFLSTAGIDTVDLGRIQSELEMIEGEEDIYIINKEGKIVNTTFKKDLGLNLFGFGEEYKKFLLEVFEDGNLRMDRFSSEASTGRLKKYAYRATKDGNYVIELGFYAEDADELMEVAMSEIRNLGERHFGVESVDIFFGKENPVCFSNREEKIAPEHMEMYTKAISGSAVNPDAPYTETFKDDGGKKKRYQFIYFNRPGSLLFQDGVIRIISDANMN